VNQQDSAFVKDVESRVAAGITREMVLSARRRFLLQQGLVILALATSLAIHLGGSGRSTGRVRVAAVLMIIVVAVSVWRLTRFAPRPGRVLGHEELTKLAAGCYRCVECHTVVLPEETDCPACGAVKNPRWAMAFGLMFGLALLLLALWRTGLLTY
jgi:hypothetical protein